MRPEASPLNSPACPGTVCLLDGSGVRVIDPAAIAKRHRKQCALQTALMTAASQGQGFAYLGVQLKRQPAAER